MSPSFAQSRKMRSPSPYDGQRLIPLRSEFPPLWLQPSADQSPSSQSNQMNRPQKIQSHVHSYTTEILIEGYQGYKVYDVIAKCHPSPAHV